MPRKPRFEEIMKVGVTETRNIVASQKFEYSKENEEQFRGYEFTEQVIVNDNNASPIRMFLKGGLRVTDLEGLYKLRDLVNAAITEENRRLGRIKETKK